MIYPFSFSSYHFRYELFTHLS